MKQGRRPPGAKKPKKAQEREMPLSTLASLPVLNPGVAMNVEKAPAPLDSEDAGTS